MSTSHEAVCAGLICLDVTPRFADAYIPFGEVFAPGRLTDIDRLILSLGGSVSNTGIAMNRLGIATLLMSKVGDDWQADQAASLLRKNNVDFALKRATGENTPHCVVLAVPGNDRVFLYNAGAGDTLSRADLDFDAISRAKLLHFGYPTAMKNMFSGDGAELRSILEAAKGAGVTTSVDTSYPGALAREQDWLTILAKTLPCTDIFTPSLEELLLMLDSGYHHALAERGGDILDHFDIDRLPDLGRVLLEMGAGVVAIKCGTLGYYLVAGDAGRLEKAGPAFAPIRSSWANRELFSSIFHIDAVASTCGAGDASVAGLLASILNGCAPEQAIDNACATGALCCTTLSTTDAILPLEEIMALVLSGWNKRQAKYAGGYFRYDREAGLYRGREAG
jgi:sugar/nucleoside kinase (ribokinase family)